MTQPRLQLSLRQAALIPALLSAILYIITAGGSAFWLDTPEFAAGAFELGIPHPPGHPLYVLLGKLATLIPVGSVAFRLALLGGLLMSASVGLSVVLAERLWGTLVRPFAAAAMCIFALTLPAWLNAVRAEVYALNLFLSLLILLLALSYRERPSAATLAGLGFVTGLGLSNHHYLIVFVAPAVLFLCFCTKDAARRMLLAGPASVLGLLLGMAPYALLVIRSSPRLIVRWGDPSTLEGFIWVITGKAFQKTSQTLENAVPIPMATKFQIFFDQQTGLAFAAVGLVGLILLVVTRDWRAGVAVTLAFAFNIVAKAVWDFDPTNPDLAGYWLLSIALLAIGIAGASMWLWRGLVRWGRAAKVAGRIAAVGTLLVLGVSLIPGGYARANLSDFSDTDEFADRLYQVIPTDGLLVTGHFETTFNLWYREVVEARRPDVPVYDRLLRTHPGFDEGFLFRFPDFEPLLEADPRTAGVNVPWIIEQSRLRPILVELLPPDPSLFTPPIRRLRRHLAPAGLVTRVLPVPIDPRGFRGEAVAEEMFWDDLVSHVDPETRETRNTLLWNYYNRALLLEEQGRLERARWYANRALELTPSDPWLQELAARLGNSP
ncbi:MAG: DUF2723 domain-containing protein [Myxococcales bacterium]|nr:DUF2723 domain-containing protein [Myxococcales bacterium]